MTKADARPRVFLCMPSLGECRVEAAASHYALPTRGKCEIIPGLSTSSLLCFGFNLNWATALNWQRAGMIDCFAMLHSDVQVLTHGWVDVLVAEMKRVGAAWLSAIVPIKDDTGLTSTAVESGNPWAPRKLSLEEIGRLPETFRAEDVPGNAGPLLVNTGCWIADLSHPAWRRTRTDGSLAFHFNIADRLMPKEDGELVAQVKPEDWQASRLAAELGAPVYATTKVELLHHGDRAWSNKPPRPEPLALAGHYFHEIAGWADADLLDVYRNAVNRVPEGGQIVEVGCWKGKSLSFLLVEARDSGKALKITGVDHFRGSVGQPEMLKHAEETDLEAECRANAKRAGYPFHLLRMSSVQAAKTFADGEIDFAFIDGSHDAASVSADIAAWLPRVKPLGRLAGHDYDEVGVFTAVKKLLPQARGQGRCWVYDVPKEG